MTTLTLISKPDCHLCDVAREVIDVVKGGHVRPVLMIAQRLSLPVAGVLTRCRGHCSQEKCQEEECYGLHAS